jgi:hypothetical protein
MECRKQFGEMNMIEDDLSMWSEVALAYLIF